MPRLDELVALPGYRPKDWQSPTPMLMWERGMPVGYSPDLERILALPRRQPYDTADRDSVRVRALVEFEMAKYGRSTRSCRCKLIDSRRDCITCLLPVQAWMLNEMTLAGGLVAAASTGSGKTIPFLLAPLALGIELGLLLIPPSLVDQILVDYQLLQQHFKTPMLTVHGGGAQDLRPEPNDNTDRNVMLHVLPYSRLSQPTSSDWLEGLSPQALICDEADSISAMTSARTMRVARYMNAHPNTKFACGTGSLTDKSLSEFAHLLVWALRLRSPLPIDPEVVRDWGRCLDAVPSPAPPGELLRLCEPGESVRNGFRRRLVETLGVVVTTSSNVEVHGDLEGREVDLVIHERQAPPIPPIIEEALAKVRNFQRPDTLAGSPDDEELVDVMSQAKCAMEVATGCFYRWIFPRGEPTATILEWFAARKLWHRELRSKLLNGDEFLDSPKLCENAARRAWGDLPPDKDRPSWHAIHWPRWREIKDQVEPQTQAVRLHPYLVEDVANWALSHRGIVWYSMVELAHWIYELTGLPVHTGGPRAGEFLRAERGDRSIIASLKSHGRGRDGLQHLFNEQLLITPPSSARVTQQLLARLHRRGQRSLAVQTWFYAHTEELQRAIEQATRRAEYVQGILGERQKLLDGYKP